MPPKNNACSWGHDYFLKHPSASFTPKVPAAFADDKLMRKKVFCKLCFAASVRDEIKNDNEAIQAGTRSVAREQQTIEEACAFSILFKKVYMY